MVKVTPSEGYDDSVGLWPQLSRLVTTKAPLITALTLAAHLIAIVTVATLANRYTAIPTTYGQNSGFQSENRWGREAFQNNRLYSLLKDPANNNFTGTKLGQQRVQSVQGDFVELILSAQENCLTKTNLQAQHVLELETLNSTSYRSLCWMQVADSCTKPTSVLRLFDGTYEHLNIMVDGKNVFRPDPAFLRISEILMYAAAADGNSLLPELLAAGSPDIQPFMNTVLGLDFNPVTSSALHCRTQFSTGLPVSGYANAQDSVLDQQDTVGELMVEAFHGLRDYQLLDMSIGYWSPRLEIAVQREDLRSLRLWMLLSVAVVVLGLSVGTKSVLVGILSSVALVGCYCWSLLLTTIVCGYGNWTPMQNVAWLALVLIYMTQAIATSTRFNKARRSHLISSGLWLRSHCIEVAIMGLCMALFAAVTMSMSLVALNRTATVLMFITVTNAASQLLCTPALFCLATLSIASDEESDKPQPPKNSTKGFRRHVIGNAVARWVIVAFMLVTVVVFLILAIVHVRYNTNKPSIWHSSSGLAQYHEHQGKFQHEFTDLAATAVLTFGAKGLDGSCSLRNPSCTTSIEFDHNLDLTSTTVQRAALELCTTLQDTALSMKSALGLQETRDGGVSVQCPFSAMQLFFDIQGVEWPLSEEVITHYLNSSVGGYAPNSFDALIGANGTVATYYRLFEAAMVNWLSNNNTEGATFNEYASLVGGVADSTAKVDANGTVTNQGLYGDRLNHFSVRFQLSSNQYELDAAAVLASEMAWKELVENLTTSLPLPFQSIFFASPFDRIWQQAHASKVFVTEYTIGLVIGGFLCFVAFAVTTSSVGLALVAFLLSSATIVIAVGTFGVLGWELDMISGMAFLIASFCIAHILIRAMLEYTKPQKNDSGLETSQAAVKRSLLMLLCSGGTVMLASLPLYVSKLKLIAQIATSLLLVCGVGVLFAVLFIPTVYAIFGPDGGEEEQQLDVHADTPVETSV
eukprot:m.14649 g.14649  ORF g.14649 m.14649 type:complete len:976 (+) comp6391_c0_seq1:1114-4041(+)